MNPNQLISVLDSYRMGNSSYYRCFDMLTLFVIFVIFFLIIHSLNFHQLFEPQLKPDFVRNVIGESKVKK